MAAKELEEKLRNQSTSAKAKYYGYGMDNMITKQVLDSVYYGKTRVRSPQRIMIATKRRLAL